MLSGLTAGFLTGLLGWQINLIAIHRGIERGRRAGFLVGLGAAAGDFVWISAAFAGAQTLLTSHPEFWNPLKWLGVFTITAAALRIFFARSKKEIKKKRWNPSKSLLIGLLVVLGNPALLIIWMNVIGYLLRTHALKDTPGLLQILFLGGFLAGEMLWYAILFLFIFPAAQRWSEQRFEFISKSFSGLLLLGAGIFTFKMLTQ